MTQILLTPPVAFVIYLALVGLLAGAGRMLAGASKDSELKSSIYASGEEAQTWVAAPGYRPFFVIALFFAMLHLGILVLGTGELTAITGAYVVGLALALLALILG
jgi:hypothetical protein